MDDSFALSKTTCVFRVRVGVPQVDEETAAAAMLVVVIAIRAESRIGGPLIWGIVWCASS